MKKILEGLFIIGFVFIGAQVQAALTTGNISPTTTTKVTTNTTPTSSATDIKVCCASFGYGSNMVKTNNSYKSVNKNECVYPAGLVGGGKEVVSDSFCKTTPTIEITTDPIVPTKIEITIPPPTHPDPVVMGCSVGFNYNPETGKQCSDVLIKDGCFKGFNYSSITGQKCSIVPSITVLSPNGGESLSKGKTETIKWLDTTPVLYNNNGTSFFYYDVSLIKAQNPCTQKTCPVADSYLVSSKIKIPQGGKTNSFDWIVGNTDQKNKVVPDGAYMIQICKTDVKTCDLSDSYFKINSEKTSTSITVLSPNGKETYKLGDKINISWKSSMDLDDSQVNIALINDDTNACKVEQGRTGTVQPGGSVTIVTYGLNGSNCNEILVHPTNASGTWLSQDQLNATSKPNGTYLIDTSHLGGLNSAFNAGVKYKIAVCIDKTCDTSDNYFTITDSTPNSSNAYGTDICPSNMINPYSLCKDGNIQADKKDGNGCTLSYKCTNPSSAISPNTSNSYGSMDPNSQIGKSCPLNMINPYSLCKDGNIQADKKDANGCTLSYKCTNPSSTISSTTPTISPRILIVGVKGDDVAALQTLLGITADGSFGPMTKAKVMEWQLTNGLTPDGVFGNMSRLKAGL